MTEALILDFLGVLITSSGKNTDLIELIKDLKQRSYKLAILSNLSSSKPIERALTAAELALFDIIAPSYQLGHEKPYSGAYLCVADQLGLTPASCVFVDDSPANCRGAAAVGMQALRYIDMPNLKLGLKQLLT